MNIGIDIDGTITENPAFFALISRALRKDAHEVHIISYRVGIDAFTKQQLKLWNIEYDVLHLPPESRPGYPTPSAAKWKSSVMRANEIDIMFDDDADVISNAPDGTLCFWQCAGLVETLKNEQICTSEESFL